MDYNVGNKDPVLKGLINFLHVCMRVRQLSRTDVWRRQVQLQTVRTTVCVDMWPVCTQAAAVSHSSRDALLQQHFSCIAATGNISSITQRHSHYSSQLLTPTWSRSLHNRHPCAVNKSCLVAWQVSSVYWLQVFIHANNVTHNTILFRATHFKQTWVTYVVSLIVFYCFCLNILKITPAQPLYFPWQQLWSDTYCPGNILIFLPFTHPNKLRSGLNTILLS